MVEPKRPSVIARPVSSLPVLNTDVVRDWSPEQVSKWLEASNMTSCIPAFVENEIDGQSLLLLTATDLVDLTGSVTAAQQLQKALGTL